MRVHVTRSRLLGGGSLTRAPRPLAGWLYNARADDGRRFDNRNIGELRRVLHRRYGRDVEIIEMWKGRADGG
jgi:hypothetical protein